MNRFFTLLLAASCITAVGQYQVGDVGPAGGWIFYVDSLDEFDWDYLEVWNQQIGLFSASCAWSPITTQWSVGSGIENTRLFEGDIWSGNRLNVFDFTRLFDGGGKNDWFVPSRDEVQAIHDSGIGLLLNGGGGHFVTVTSTNHNGCIWYQFDSNYGWNVDNTTNYVVVPVRQFSDADDGTTCGQGTIWDEASQTCIPDNPSDLNYDGCVDVNDFMGHLAAFGSGCEEGVAETPWQCGDPLEYQGYDYQTVQIGEQCWFAENLRAENYKNGDAIPSGLSDSEWENTTSGAVAVYGEGSSSCLSSAPSGDACDESFSLQEYGRLYNWYAVTDERMLCPQGWRVMKVTDWNTLSAFVETESGIAASLALQSVSGWLDWPGGGVPQDLFGFSIVPGGLRKEQSGDWLFEYAGSYANIWTTGYQSDGSSFRVSMNSFETQTLVTAIGTRNGCSVRCIKD